MEFNSEIRFQNAKFLLIHLVKLKGDNTVKYKILEENTDQLNSLLELLLDNLKITDNKIKTAFYELSDEFKIKFVLDALNFGRDILEDLYGHVILEKSHNHEIVNNDFHIPSPNSFFSLNKEERRNSLTKKEKGKNSTTKKENNISFLSRLPTAIILNVINPMQGDCSIATKNASLCKPNFKYSNPFSKVKLNCEKYCFDNFEKWIMNKEIKNTLLNGEHKDIGSKILFEDKSKTLGRLLKLIKLIEEAEKELLLFYPGYNSKIVINLEFPVYPVSPQKINVTKHLISSGLLKPDVYKKLNIYLTFYSNWWEDVKLETMLQDTDLDAISISIKVDLLSIMFESEKTKVVDETIHQLMVGIINEEDYMYIPEEVKLVREVTSDIIKYLPLVFKASPTDYSLLNLRFDYI